MTARLPVIGYDKEPKAAHCAAHKLLTHKEATLKLGFVTEDELDHGVELAQLVKPYVTNKR